MRIFFLGNNWLGWQVCRWLVERGENIVGAALHPASKLKYGSEIKAVLPARTPIFPGNKLKEAAIVDGIVELKPDIGISILFDYILKKPFLNILPSGCINLHPAYLPFNKGQYPNVWSIVEKTTAGTTLHYIDEGIDTGNIIAQKLVEVEPVDTGQTLYGKLERTSLELFQQSWPDVKAGKARSSAIAIGAGTYHKTTDVEKIDHIELDRQYAAGDLIDILRARTFPPHKGAYFVVDGKKVFMRLKLEYEEESDS